MKKFGKIVGFIGLCLFAVGASYFLTQYLDKNLYLNTELEVTFEDTKEFTLENKNKLTKEEAVKEYPNRILVENKSLKKVDYTISIDNKNTDNLDSLNYVLYLNDKEVKEGNLKDLKDNILYETKIEKKKTDTYKLYVYLTKDIEDIDYTYTIVVNSK